MSAWPEVALGDICELRYGKALAGKNRDDGSYAVYGSNGVVGWHSRAITSGPTVIVGRKGSLGEIAYSESACWPIDTAYYVDQASTRVDLKWLSYSLRELGLQKLNKSAAIPGLSRDDAYRQRLLLPPIEAQRKIVAILDQADNLRTKRQEILEALISLDLAVFESMFPDYSGHDASTVPLEDVLVAIESGSSPVCESRPAGSHEWGVLKLGAVTYGTFRPDENKVFLGSIVGMERHEVRTGDVLMTRKNTRDLVGAVAIVDETRPHLLMPDLVFRLRLNTDKVTPKYFQALMMAPKMRRVVRNLSSGSAASMPNISKARLSRLRIHLPSLSQQVAFTERRQSLDSERGIAARQLVVAEELLASLQSRAFRGEL